MVLALAQMIQGDDIVLDEARQSIGSLTSSEMGWLKEVQKLANKCESFCRDHAALRPTAKSQPGDIAVYKNIDGWHLRIVSGSGEKLVYLVALDRQKDRVPYAANHLAVARL